MNQSVVEKPDALIAYVKWNRVVPWKILSLPTSEESHFFPIGYGSDQPILRSRVREGTQIWVVTLPWIELKDTQEIRAFPIVTLVARLHVQGVYTEESERASPLLQNHGVQKLLKIWDRVAVSSPEGQNQFFGLTCVNQQLLDLKILTQDDLKDDAELRGRVGSRLQSIRIVDGGVPAAQQAFEGTPSNTSRLKTQIFFSFKSEPHFAEALKLALRLSNLGFNCWLDSFTIPQYSTEKDAEVSVGRLQQLLRWGIEQSRVAIAFISDEYARDAKGWTGLERALIQSRKEHSGEEFYAYGILDKVPDNPNRDAAFHETGTRDSIDDLVRKLEARFPC